MNKFKVLDLFSGAGGMAEGFLQAGFHIPCATDYSKEAAETYINRHNQLGYDVNYFCGDIRDLTRKRGKLKEFICNHKIDVVVGGPPCQGFSLSGKRDENDFRNLLFLQFLKMIEKVKPSYFVMENVSGLLSYKFTKIEGLDKEIYEDVLPQEVIQKEALKMGYFVKWNLLNAKDYGVPQNRPRVIFLGHRIRRYKGGKYKDLVKPLEFPEIQNRIVTVEEAISDLAFLQNGEISKSYIEKCIDQSDYQKRLHRGLTPDINGNTVKTKLLYNHQASNHNEKTISRFKLLNSGESVSELFNRLPDNLREQYFTKKFRCTKLNKESVSPTVLTLPDDIIHYAPNNPRILTVRELARLQSFDDSFEFLGKRTTGGDRRKYETPQYTQVGNAVPPLFSRAIAEKVKEALINSRDLC
ncbi:DNA cytosine methyltransferase [Bacillus thuringiensis]